MSSAKTVVGLLFSSALIVGCAPKPTVTETSVSFSGKIVTVDPVWKGPAPNPEQRRQVQIDFAAPAPGWADMKGQAYWDAEEKRHRYDADTMRHTMTVALEDAKFLDGLASGDLVEGEAKVIKTVRDYGTSTSVVITNLHKSK